MHFSTLASVAIFATAIYAATLQTRTSCSVVSNVKHTFYGYPDNDPAGAAIAYDCGRGYKAGGTGSYSNPLTFASASGEFEQCEIIYDPFLKKYLRYEDYCAQCTTDWKKGTHHIDVWTGSVTVNGGQNQINCEDDLTPGAQKIVRNPSHNLPTDTTSLYVKGANPSCRTSHEYWSYNIDEYC